MEELYELPESWIRTKLGDISTLVSGGTPSRGIPSYWKEDIPWVKISDIPSDGVVKETAEYISCEGYRNSSAILLPPGTILFTIFATIGKVGILDIRATTNQAIVGIFPEKGIDNKYLFYVLRNVGFRLYMESHGIAQNNINLTITRKLKIPLPPLNEQHRIVSKIETLLAQVETSKEYLAKALPLITRFRRNVLNVACSGRLTENWRKKYSNLESAVSALMKHAMSTIDQPRNKRRMRSAKGLTLLDYSSYLPKNWGWFKIRELVKKGAIIDVQDGNHGELYPRENDFGTHGIPYIGAEQIANGRVWLDEAPLLSFSKANKLRVGFAKPGDVLLTHNATVGRVAVLPLGAPEVILSTSATYYRVDENMLKRGFLAMVFRSGYFQNQLRTIMEQTTRNQVSVTKQVELSIQLPPIEEQQEIIRRVDALLDVIESIEQYCQKARIYVDQLTQSILTKAFRGELVPQDPNDEPASILLERIKKEKSKLKKKKAPKGNSKTLLDFIENATENGERLA